MTEIRGPIQGTGGSSAIANSYMQLRKAGAAARQMLVAAAAERWNVGVDGISVENGVVRHGASGRTARFGELAESAVRQTVPEDPPLKSPEQFKLIGRDVPRKDVGKLDGTAVYTQDIHLPLGQLTAVVAHPPRFGAVVRDFNAAEALRLPGVEQVFAIPAGVAVVARDYWTAKKARDLVKINWDESRAFNMGSDEIMAKYRALAETPGAVARREGDAAAALAGADRVFEATYEFPYLAHAAMEPMNCVVQVNDSGCELWYGAQIQTLDQMAVAEILGLNPAQVKINTLYAGGSFGRRANSHSDYVREAVFIARELPRGTPVKLVWSREDDTRAGYYRPLNYHRIRAALDGQGMPLAWEHRIPSCPLFGHPVDSAQLKAHV